MFAWSASEAVALQSAPSPALNLPVRSDEAVNEDRTTSGADTVLRACFDHRDFSPETSSASAAVSPTGPA
jgi:hypothetical protein